MESAQIHRLATDEGSFAQWFARSGLSGDPRVLYDLLAGVAAAPPSHPEDAWFALLPAQPSGEVKETLRAVVDRLRDRPLGYQRKNLEGVRAELEQQELDGLIVLRADELPGKFLPLAAERVAWLTGFTGSAAEVVILADRCALFTDGRYQLQAKRQVDTDAVEIRHIVRQPMSEWFLEKLSPGDRIGIDPRIVTAARAQQFEQQVSAAGATLALIKHNPIDTLWRDRPPYPLSPVVPHDTAFTGRDSVSKRREVGETLEKKGLDAFVLTQPESVAWLLNIRGQDVPNTPLALGCLIVDESGHVDLYMDERKVLAATRQHLCNAVTLRPPRALEADIGRLGVAGKTVGYDPQSLNAWIKGRLIESGAELVEVPDPCVLPRARKTPQEIDGARAAHRRDGLAVTKFIRWISEQAVKRAVTEYEAAQRVTEYRAEGQNFRGTSFNPIVGAGPNGAIIHYSATPESSRTIDRDSILLVDSGGQYLDGTTDITRTIAIGTPTDEMKHFFTLVLKGHIALATARFPKGTTGRELNALARQFLWREGRDFDHGTGHGVGSYLGVHEGPQNISSNAAVPLEPGMIVSNEPGYYVAEKFGIRIENLVCVREASVEGADLPMLEFETLSIAPIDRNLVEPSLLTREELDWLNTYHQWVFETHRAKLGKDARAWLKEATRPLE